ncbi:PREDICTED: uncharacterized protein LOC107101405 [Cyprinodon variegatus]|uniref:uncharacterized protein LOC107101405 n=1 Tax=Cyprinodon variegatus TaxID=28743 RepID=UPI0007426801|nr:PREDICTED: uncharacterized protein LOC107101405 [Cyprinodon variegatus]XP_015255788.1 PREDICTED: uncharacterized protein LOC107101405 [Cyprinodon variegatus]XP_015255789.1 PREDICTED: uncharacterized protein LOC107101405 [Cyprinodon variegatus]
MDVSIAVSLIRGQMGTVVERAVNTAVETVLAEMLKVVGVKFEELKAQVVVMKRDVMALQREKALKEKENDNIRAKLRYTELKLKYYRQGVEEELQQRASASASVRIQPPTLNRMQRCEASASASEVPLLNPAQKSAEETRFRSRQECTSSDSTNRPAARVCCPSDGASSDSSDLLLPVTLTLNTAAESLDSNAVFFSHSEHDASQREDSDRDVEWTISMQPYTERSAEAPASVRTLTLLSGQQSTAAPPSPEVSTQVDSSMLPSSALEVKQEVQPSQEEEEEVICIKEEPAEEQEVMADLLLDCQAEQSRAPEPEAQRLVAEPMRSSASQMNPSSKFPPAAPCVYSLPQHAGSPPSTTAMQPGGLPRAAVRPWNKDLSLYEEYKLRRNELRRRNLNRRRELEKSLPQPLLADLVRERREKTRLRVAKWRAKRKLQACLNQTQAHGGATGQAGVPVHSQHQQHRTSCASSSQQRKNSVAPNTHSFLCSVSTNSPTILPAVPSSSLILRGPNVAPHEHAVTSSSSSYDRVGQSQRSISLTDVHFPQ